MFREDHSWPTTEGDTIERTPKTGMLPRERSAAGLVGPASERSPQPFSSRVMAARSSSTPGNEPRPLPHRPTPGLGRQTPCLTHPQPWSLAQQPLARPWVVGSCGAGGGSLQSVRAVCSASQLGFAGVGFQSSCVSWPLAFCLTQRA